MEEIETEKRISIYVDGSCKKVKSGETVGAYALVAYDEDTGLRIQRETRSQMGITNQRMELEGLLAGFEIADIYIKRNKDAEITINSDSAYAIKCATEWPQKWELNDWNNSKGEKIANLKLIQKIYEKHTKFLPPNIHVQWVKGHTGKADGNDEVDKLAQEAAQQLKDTMNNHPLLDKEVKKMYNS